MAVSFQFQHPVKLPSRRKLKSLVKTIFVEEGRILGNLDIIFCSDQYLREINRTFLSHDYFTDIITFDYSIDAIKTGEIYISVESATENAQLYNVLLFNELTRLIAHGSLHLCGYLDKTEADKKAMTQKEDHYLSYFDGL